MKIVVLDGYALNPGDLSWESLMQLGDVEIHERTPKELVLERAKAAEVLITNKTVLDEEVLSHLPALRYIGVLATGYNVVDVQAAAMRGITVTNIPGYSTASVAQMTFALLLELCHHVQEHSDAVKAGFWEQSRDFCFWNHPLLELEGKTFGIIGFGTIGQRTAELAAAFGMKVIGFSRNRSDQSHRPYFRWAELDELLEASDVVSLHCPLTEETRGLICTKRLQRMKKSAFLINTARGPLVVEQELADALNNGMLAGAAVDVLSVEPPKPGNPLLTAKNCIITPHIAWATREARTRLMDIAVENLKAFQAGKPMNVVTK